MTVTKEHVLGIGTEMAEPEGVVLYTVRLRNGAECVLGLYAHTYGPYGEATGIFNVETEEAKAFEIERIAKELGITTGLARAIIRRVTRTA